jgi:peptidyl-prolyl cis-trans isomerase C
MILLASRPRIAVLVLPLAFAGRLAAQESPPPAPPANPAAARVVARVNSKEITLGEFSKALDQYVVAKRLGPDSGIPIADIQKAVLDRMIATTLVDQRAEALGLSASAEEVEARLAQMRSEAGDPANFRLMLAVQNVSEEMLRAQIAGQITAEKLIDQEVFAKIEVPEADVKSYYDAHRAELMRPERAKVRQIFVAIRRDMSDADRAAARARIDAVKARLDKGEEFGALAVELSEHRSAASGGDLGWLRKDEVSGPFQLVAFTAPIGKVSDVVATEYGYLLLEVMERQDARPMTLEEARPQIVAARQDERVPQAVQDYLAGLRSKAQVETFLPQP